MKETKMKTLVAVLLFISFIGLPGISLAEWAGKFTEDKIRSVIEAPKFERMPSITRSPVGEYLVFYSVEARHVSGGTEAGVNEFEMILYIFEDGTWLIPDDLYEESGVWFQNGNAVHLLGNYHDGCFDEYEYIGNAAYELTLLTDGTLTGYCMQWEDGLGVARFMTVETEPW